MFLKIPFSSVVDPRVNKPSGWHMKPFNSNGPGTSGNIADYMIDIAKTHKTSSTWWSINDWNIYNFLWCICSNY